MLWRTAMLATIAFGAAGSPARGADLTPTAPPREEAKPGLDGFEFSGGGGLASDYVYRGISLSARRPSASATFTAQRDLFYLETEVRSVSLPTQPAAEISAAVGLRPKIGDIQFDLGATYYDYPGQILTAGATSLNYWEASLNASYDVRPDVTIGGQVAWSPNYGGIGAWGAYAEGNLKIKLPKLGLPEGVEWELNAIVGRSWFGNTPSLQGGLPAYTHWQAGVAFKYQASVSI